MLNKEVLIRMNLIDHEMQHLKNKIDALKNGFVIHAKEPLEKPEIQVRMIEYAIELKHMEEQLKKLQKERAHLVQHLRIINSVT